MVRSMYSHRGPSRSAGRRGMPGRLASVSSATGATIMKRTVSALAVAALAAGSLCGAGDSQEIRREGTEAAPGATTQAAARTDDERAIRQAIDAFAQAFARGDARAIAGLFTEEGEA